MSNSFKYYFKLPSWRWSGWISRWSWVTSRSWSRTVWAIRTAPWAAIRAAWRAAIRTSRAWARRVRRWATDRNFLVKSRNEFFRNNQRQDWNIWNWFGLTFRIFQPEVEKDEKRRKTNRNWPNKTLFDSLMLINMLGIN